MKTQWVKLLLPLLALVLILGAGVLKCSVCGRRINGQYFSGENGKAYCSQACLDRVLPRCSVCGKIARGAYYKNGDKIYCSKACLNSTFPVCNGCGEHAAAGVMFKAEKDVFYCSQCAAAPKCFACLLPALEGEHLEDGRMLCRQCAPSAVRTFAEAETLFGEVRETMRREFNLGTNHRIHLRMVDQPALQRRSTNYAPGVEMGLFVYDATIKTVTRSNPLLPGEKPQTETYRSDVSYTIFFLSDTPKNKLIEVFAHELGHDWMTEYYPDVLSVKIKEGFSEYCSWLVNRHYNHTALNRRIMENPDPTYGGGFRIIYQLHQKDGLNEIKRFLRRSNQ